MKIKKYIQIEDEVLVRLVEGKCVEGSLRRDEWTGQLTFRAYNRQSRCRERSEKLLRKTPYGRVTQTMKRIKRYISIPIDMPLLEKLATFDEENRLAKDALIDYEIINRV